MSDALAMESPEHIVFKVLFELENGVESPDVWENLGLSLIANGKHAGEYQVTPDKTLLRGGDLYSSLPFGLAGGYFWNNGKVYDSSSLPSGMRVMGKFGPDSIMRYSDIVYPGIRGEAAGAGYPTWDRQLDPRQQAYSEGHLAALQELLDSPVVQKLVRGLDPLTGSGESQDAKLVRRVLAKHRKEHGIGKAGKEIRAFDTWAKLMTFLQDVYAAFDARGGENPLDEAWLATVPSILSPEMFGKGGALNSVAFERKRKPDGTLESDQEFYIRVFGSTDKGGEDVALGRSFPPQNLESYRNWVIDRMVKNLWDAATRLYANEANLRPQGRRIGQLIRTSSEKEGKGAAWQKARGDAAYLGSLRSHITKLERKIGLFRAAIAKAERWEEGVSFDDRVLSFEEKLDKLEKFKAKESSGERGSERRRKASIIYKDWTKGWGARIKNEEGKEYVMRGDGISKMLDYLHAQRNVAIRDAMTGKEYRSESIEVARTFFNECIDRLNRQIKEDEKKIREEIPEHTKYAEMFLNKPVPNLRMFQMAVPKSSIATVGDIISGKQSALAIDNANTRIVSAGILLGKTGMSLTDVRRACIEYRRRRRVKGSDAAEIFEKLFHVNPFDIPSDERLKDFHKGWKEIEDSRDRGQRILEAVGRRFY